MRLRSCETYWLLKNGLINSYPSLRKNIECEILVVGGGITGSLIAFQLSKEGYSTVMIDKRDVSLGSTSATTALLQYEIDEPLYTLTERVGKEAATASYLGGIDAIDRLEQLVKSENLDCGFARKSSLYVAHNNKYKGNLMQEFECRKEAGIKVNWITADQLSNTWGVSGKGAILSESAGSVDGYRLAHALLSQATHQYGLEVYDHTEIAGVKHGVSNIDVQIAGDFHITCKKIIYTTGYESQTMIREKIVDLHSTYACVSEPMLDISHNLVDTLIWDTEDPYLYVRTTPDSRILVGGCDESFKNPEKRDRLIDKKETVLMKKLVKLLPQLKIIPDFCWAGTFGVTKDALPYIGAHPDFPNSYFVLGFGGNGITFSLMGMQIISDALQGKSNDYLKYFRFGR